MEGELRAGPAWQTVAHSSSRQMLNGKANGPRAKSPAILTAAFKHGLDRTIRAQICPLP